MKKPLKFANYTISFQEVPNEISLLINIVGCELRCEGCHSKHLWDYEGEYLSEGIYPLLDKYSNYITCVCFLGGDHSVNELIKISQIIRNSYGLKVCLYSGRDSMGALFDVLQYLDYIKIGSYQKIKGGLDSPNTNQRFYQIDKGCRLINLTHEFTKKGEI